MAVANVTSIVLPGKFEPNKDKWQNYREQLFFALEAAGPLESAQKRALFLSQCGKEAFSLIVSLLSPRKPSEVPFDDIIETLNKFFTPVPHPILETQKFYARKQKADESITSFVAALHDISSRCAFENLHRRIAEQLILGMRDDSVRKELLRMRLCDVSYDTIVQRALNMEALQQEIKAGCSTENQQIAAQKETSEPMEVNKISATTSARQRNAKPCEHCAKRHASICIVECESKTESESGTSEDNFGVYSVTAAAGAVPVKPYIVEVMINGIPIPMQIDSGSANAILPHSVYLLHQEAFTGELRPCDRKLVTWTSDALKIRGEIEVDVEFQDRKGKLPLIVCCGNGPALLGRAWFDALGIEVQVVNSVTEEKAARSFPKLFDGEMGDYKGPLVHITLKKDAKPVIYNCDQKWKRGVVEGMIAPSLYAVRGSDGVVHRRHVDQLLRSRPPGHTEAQAYRQHASDTNSDDDDNDSVIVPPPEEWAEIIGVSNGANSV
ncbi:hypothetical protein NE865_06164 [Phthorimaea operculella]|nr:hypothetical protein NE865_06164 [Phthorimaea operculella]